MARTTFFSLPNTYHILDDARELKLIKADEVDSPGRPRVSRDRIREVSVRLEQAPPQVERAKAVAGLVGCSPSTVYRAWSEA